MATADKLNFVLASGAIWALVAAADAIARGLATARQNDYVATLPTGLKAKKTKGTDSPGWTVAAVRFSGGTGGDDPCYLLVKSGQPAEWVSKDDLDFT
jgi:hypothetical protein